MKRGFTLLELMAVLLMLSIVIGVVAGHFKKAPPVVNSYKLSNGEVVNCSLVYRTDCGMMLSECSNGNKYTCHVNVVELSGK